MPIPAAVGGTIEILSGNGQFGLVSVGVTRVSASMPTVTTTAVALMVGCAATARIGLSSSQSGGSDAVVPVPCSGIERQALAHCSRAVRSSVLSLRMRSLTALSCSPTVLSITGLTCAGTLTRAPAITRLVSPRMTCAPKFGSTCQVCASFGRMVMTTLPRISALALIALMLTLPMRLAASAPSSPPMASPTAPVAFEVSEPVTLSLPLIGVVSDSTSWVPVARIGPREAVQPMSASCSNCDTGLSALPAKLRGAARSAASRMAVSEIATGAITTELRGAGGSGGNCASCGVVQPGARRQPVHRFQADEKRDGDHDDPEQDRSRPHRQFR